MHLEAKLPAHLHAKHVRGAQESQELLDFRGPCGRPCHPVWSVCIHIVVA